MVRFLYFCLYYSYNNQHIKISNYKIYMILEILIEQINAGILSSKQQNNIYF